jgi:hypothetical protein
VPNIFVVHSPNPVHCLEQDEAVKRGAEALPGWKERNVADAPRRPTHGFTVEGVFIMSRPADLNHPSQKVLNAYALRPETVDQAITQHIKQCETCMRDVTAIVLLQRSLKKKLFRFDCPSEEKLTAYALHKLPLWERMAIEAHLPNCQHCSEEIRIIQRVAEDFLPSPSSAPWETVRRIRALLQPQSPQYGLRELEGAGEPSPAIYTFAAEEIKGYLGSYEGERGMFFLTGRLQSQQAEQPLTAIAARLLQASEAQQNALVSEATIEPDGFFELGPALPGTYQLEVLLSNRLVEIGSVRL